jgi:hypothetical protein
LHLPQSRLPGNTLAAGAKCGESRTMKAPDPMNSNSAGWLAGELKPPV